jgi:hypothetical protein
LASPNPIAGPTFNDNPYSESQFRTLKYRPEFPDRFGCLQAHSPHDASGTLAAAYEKPTFANASGPVPPEPNAERSGGKWTNGHYREAPLRRSRDSQYSMLPAGRCEQTVDFGRDHSGFEHGVH